jgi:hypothetical protein
MVFLPEQLEKWDSITSFIHHSNRKKHLDEIHIQELDAI